jgi:hypothetical protein
MAVINPYARLASTFDFRVDSIVASYHTGHHAVRRCQAPL